MVAVKIYPCKNFGGSVDIPGDKSISHRALMFASLAQGASVIENLLEGHDCLATLEVMRSLGVHIELHNETWLVHGKAKIGLVEPTSVLDCKNSGTTIRLMAGLLSAMPFMSVLDGTDQIKSRPMDRIISPLRTLGATIFGRHNNSLAPLVTIPSNIVGGSYELPVKSAQVKSALILAGLFAQTPTIISNTKATRDHTERLLMHMGADIKLFDDKVVVNPLKQDLQPFVIRVAGDISSAAFLLVAGAVLAKNGLMLRGVGINQTRTGIIDALNMMGARVAINNQRIVANEHVADIHIEKSHLVGAQFSGDHVVRMIDEIPVLALLATQAEGVTVIKDAHELKVKESNRIKKTVELLNTVGAKTEEIEDGIKIFGPTPLKGAHVSSYGDHRLGMMMSIAGLMADGPVIVDGAQVSDDSFPGFYTRLNELGAKTEV